MRNGGAASSKQPPEPTAQADTLGYANADSPFSERSRRDPVLVAMTARHARTSAQAVALLALSVLIILGASTLIGMVVTQVLFHLGVRSGLFLFAFGGTLMAQVLMVVYKLMRRDDRYVRYTIDPLADASRPSSQGEYEMRAMHAQAQFMLELIVWGPATAAESIRQLSGCAVMPRSRRLELSVLIIHKLLDATQAVPIRQLTGVTTDGRELIRTIRWLEKNHYVGLSSDHKRVWLSGEFKAELMRQGRG